MSSINGNGCWLLNQFPSGKGGYDWMGGEFSFFTSNQTKKSANTHRPTTAKLILVHLKLRIIILQNSIET